MIAEGSINFELCVVCCVLCAVCCVMCYVLCAVCCGVLCVRRNACFCVHLVTSKLMYFMSHLWLQLAVIFNSSLLTKYQMQDVKVKYGPPNGRARRK